MLPRVILHNLISLDGRIDGFPADAGLYYDLLPTWNEDATLAGSSTILAASDEVPEEDDSVFAEPAEIAQNTRPLLVICDSEGRVRSWHYWRQLPAWRGAVALICASTPEDYRNYLRKRHIDIIECGEERVDLRAALEELSARYGVKVVRVDSGGRLGAALLLAGLVDEVSVVISPHISGDANCPFFRAQPDACFETPVVLTLLDAQTLRDGHVWVRYSVIKTNPDERSSTQDT